MLATDFIAKWRSADLTERAAAQSHFCELCDLLGEETPTNADPKGESYAFEKGATKTTGGEGWADVWKRGCFGWGDKSKGRDLRAAYAPLHRYPPPPDHPPPLIFSPPPPPHPPPLYHHPHPLPPIPPPPP